MDLPPGLTEAEVLRTVEVVVRRLAKRYVFGYFAKEDIEQEARYLALEAVKRWRQPKGALENFLQRHVHNRLINLRRNKYTRTDTPCDECRQASLAMEPASAHGGAGLCPKFMAWKVRNQTKARLMRTQTFAEENKGKKLLTSERSGLTDILSEERETLDEALPASLRGAYLRILAGEKVRKDERDGLAAFLRQRLQGQVNNDG
jgi:DNA-directed RNA polymerase specialized sigma24 family protein